MEYRKRRKELLGCFKKYNVAGVGYSCLIALGIAGSSAIGSQAIKNTYNSKLNVAFLFTYITTLFNLIILPLYLIYHYLFVKERKPLQLIFRECIVFIDDDGQNNPNSPRYLRVFLILFAFTLLWLAANYTYIKSLAYLTPTDVTALFSTSNVFVFILSLLVLNDLFYFTKLFSVVIATSAVILFFYVEKLEFNTTLGIVLAIVSAFFSALYKVIYKIIIKKGKLVHVMFTLVVIGIFSTVSTWFLLVLFHFTKFEVIPSADEFPWLMLFLRGSFALIMNLLINFGIAYTSSIVVSIGALLTIPINAIIDIFINKTSPNLMKGVASTLIALSFLMIILPDGFLNKIEPFWKRQSDSSEE